jgi:hypothetical protein
MTDLVERLEVRGACERPEGCVCGGDVPAVRKTCSWWVDMPINPDGPEAVTRIRELEAEVAALREALAFYADIEYPHPNEGPWGISSDDFGLRARQALAKLENPDAQ